MSDYADDLSINPDRLSDEWRRQPGLFMRYAEQAALARKKADIAKEALDVTDARLNMEIRAEYEGGKKPTEDAIKSEVLASVDHRAASRKYLDAKHEADLMSLAVRAFDQRKSALENLVRLFGMEYFADPKQPDFDTVKRNEAAKSELVGRKLEGRRGRTDG